MQQKGITTKNKTSSSGRLIIRKRQTPAGSKLQWPRYVAHTSHAPKINRMHDMLRNNAAVFRYNLSGRQKLKINGTVPYISKSAIYFDIQFPYFMVRVIKSATIRELAITTGSPPPGWVLAPTKYKFLRFLSKLGGRKKALCSKLWARPNVAPNLIL